MVGWWYQMDEEVLPLSTTVRDGANLLETIQ